MSAVLEIPTAAVYEPLLYPARYKGAYGGRGSGKSHFFAELLIDDAMRFPGEAGEGMRALCVREVQKALRQSAKQLIEKKLADFRIGEKDGFKVFAAVIETPGDGLIDFTGLQDHTVDSIKSYEGFHRCWGEEAQSLSMGSMTKLRPTIRWEDKKRGLESELWFSWNPMRRIDPVDVMFRSEETPTDAVSVMANWRDNPWFPSVLDQERRDCLRMNPEQYGHIWEGEYATVLEGAYFARFIQEARQDGRIGKVAPDPLMSLRAFCDLGGTGNKSDAFSIWIAQFIGKEIRVLDYYESVGQPLSAHLEWLRDRDYKPGKVDIWLPHDGKTHDRVYDVSYESALKEAGYSVEVVDNQGKGAAMARIESARRTFPQVWFDEKKCEAGLAALGWYHEKKDENRGIGLGPDHDWSSHGADAYGLMSIVYENQPTKRTKDPYKAWRTA